MAKKETKLIYNTETSKYERGMKRIQRIDKKTTMAIKRGWKSARKTLLNYKTGLVGLGAIYIVSRLTKEFEELSKVQEQAEAGMTAAMKSMGRYTEEYDRFIREAASNIQAVTTFGDEAVLQGTKFLMTYKEIGNDVMPRVMMAMTDLAGLMKGDFRSAANMLGKASMGMVGELRKAGITVDSATYKSEGFLGVLKQIEDQVKRHAIALRATRSGGLEAFGNVVDDIKEKLGLMSHIFKAFIAKTLLPRVTELNIKLGKWLENNERLIESYAEMVVLKIPKYINDIKAAFDALKGPVKFVAEHWRMIFGALIGSKFGGPIGAIIGAGAGAWMEVVKQLKGLLQGAEAGPKRYKIPPPPVSWAKPDISGIQAELAGKVGPEEKARLQAVQDAMAKESEYIEQGLQAQWDLRYTAKQKEIAMMQQLDEDYFQSQIAMHEQQALEAQEYAERQVEIQERANRLKQESDARALNTFVDNLQTAFRAFASQSKIMFALYKVIAISEAIVSGIKSAIFAWEAGMKWGGPPLAGAFMAASIAATAGMIAQIASAEIGTGGSVSAGGAVPTYPVSPITGLPETGGGGSSLTIIIEGDFIGDEAYLEMLAEKISEVVEDKDVRLVASEVT